MHFVTFYALARLPRSVALMGLARLANPVTSPALARLVGFLLPSAIWLAY